MFIVSPSLRLAWWLLLCSFPICKQVRMLTLLPFWKFSDIPLSCLVRMSQVCCSLHSIHCLRAGVAVIPMMPEVMHCLISFCGWSILFDFSIFFFTYYSVLQKSNILKEQETIHIILLENPLPEVGSGKCSFRARQSKCFQR